MIILLTELVSWIARGRPALYNFYTFDLFIILIWFFVLNGIYIGLHYYHVWQQSEHQRQEEKKLRSGGFTVRLGDQNLLIAFNEIAGFYSEGGYTYLQTLTNKKYLTVLSLDKTEKLLPEESFYRLNRQYILHRNAVTGFKRAGDGKLEISVKTAGAIPDLISVSRTKAADFKKWFQPGEA
ncbi:MAG: LytTR family transcriptional regulator DNA-binding domain-containing protein [Sphingobacteriales bacterium]|nr:LytTR family transcriptional regulator DNA-binding domain-containing protein [Sphingobacteriales bacterium]